MQTYAKLIGNQKKIRKFFEIFFTFLEKNSYFFF